MGLEEMSRTGTAAGPRCHIDNPCPNPSKTQPNSTRQSGSQQKQKKLKMLAVLIHKIIDTTKEVGGSAQVSCNADEDPTGVKRSLKMPCFLRIMGAVLRCLGRNQQCWTRIAHSLGGSSVLPEGGTSIFLRNVEVFIGEVSGLFVFIVVGTFFIALIGSRSTTSGLGAGDDVQTIHPSDDDSPLDSAFELNERSGWKRRNYGYLTHQNIGGRKKVLTWRRYS